MFVGRPVWWALTVGGADLARQLPDELTAEPVLVMALAGAATIADLSADLVTSR